jgi:hypothetical protein
MSYNPIYNGAVTAAGVKNPHRGPTPEIFRGVNFYNQNPEHPLAVFEDFRFLAPGTVTLNSGTVAHGAGEGGELLLTSTTTADQGPTVQFTGCGVIPTAGTAVCFETRIKAGAVGTPGNIVAGLCQVSTAPIGAGVLADLADYAYFSAIQELPVDFIMEDATVPDSLTSIHTLVADTYVKLGFRCVVGKSIEVFVNGVAVTSNDLVVARFPDAFVVPTFAVESEATTAPTLTVDWFAVAVADGVTD